jgi:predicted outer membrane protein
VGAAELKERHLSARPININVTTSADDRKFMTEAATAIIDQMRAADAAAQFASSKGFVEAADESRATLERIYSDLKDLAKVKGVSLPLHDSVERSGDLRKLLEKRDGGIEREYERYAERNSLRMLERFYEASRKADDRQVRAFALRYLRPIYGNYQAATWLDSSAVPAIATSQPPSAPRATEASKATATTTNAPVTASIR